MPIREFFCPEHGVFEKLVIGGKVHAESHECPYDLGENRYCGIVAPLVEFSIPAKRNPEHGIG